MVRKASFGSGLLALCAIAVVIRGLLLRQFLLENPFAHFPFSDGELYWERGGEMAAGRWISDTPFLIGPLYAYLLGAVRVCGGGLASVYGLQLLLHLATALLVALAARVRFGERAGLVAAALFLGLAEPALFTTRVLAVTLQSFLLALVWWDWARLAEADERRPAHTARVGAAIGLLALAFPAALALAPVYGAWLLSDAGGRRGLARTALGVGAAALVISPATLHNLLVSGELIPISAHAGVTLAHGNGPTSVGIYTPLSDVSTSIHEQHRDAADAFEAATGRVGSWSEVDRYFRKRVFDWWLAHPLDAAALFATKLYWTATSRHYDNVVAFSLEREHGLGRLASLLPLELPWLSGGLVLGLALVARRARRHGAEIALLAMPLLVCVVFHYTARYRLVAAPVVCGLAALAALEWRRLAWPCPLVLAVALAPLPLLALNAATGFAAVDFMRDEHAATLSRHHVLSGRLREAQGLDELAEGHYRRSIAADPDEPDARRRLYNLQVRRGEYAAALATLDELVKRRPDELQARLALAWLLAGCPDARLRSGERALHHAERAVALASLRNPDALMVLTLARAEQGRHRAAAEIASRGVALARDLGDAALLRDFESLRAHVESGRAVETPPRLLALSG